MALVRVRSVPAAAHVLTHIGRLPVEVVRLLARDIVRGLQYLHRHNLPHLCLRPDTVLLEAARRNAIQQVTEYHFVVLFFVWYYFVFLQGGVSALFCTFPPGSSSELFPEIFPPPKNPAFSTRSRSDEVLIDTSIFPGSPNHCAGFRFGSRPWGRSTPATPPPTSTSAGSPPLTPGACQLLWAPAALRLFASASAPQYLAPEAVRGSPPQGGLGFLVLHCCLGCRATQAVELASSPRLFF